MITSVLIVGLGQIGMGYDLHLNPDTHVSSHARAFSQHPEFHLIGGVDTEEQRRRTFTQTYECPSYEDLKTALEKCQPDLVVIAVPTRFHRQTLSVVLDCSQPKLVLCEKPLAYDLHDARCMVEDCAAKGVKLYVNYMRRSDPGVIEVKRRIASGEFGQPIKGVAWYSKGFFHNGSHFFNLLQYWLGEMQNAVVLNQGRLWDGVDPEPDVCINFEYGNVVFLAAWEEAYSHYTVELLSPHGRLRYEQGGESIQWQSAQPDPLFQGYTVLAAKPEKIDSGMNRYQWNVAEQLENMLNGRESQLCDGSDALLTLESMKKILGEKL